MEKMLERACSCQLVQESVFQGTRSETARSSITTKATNQAPQIVKLQW